MRLKTTIAILVAMALFLFATIPVNAAFGPRNCPGLIIRFYANVESAYAALSACDADAIGYELTSELYISATEDPNICVAPVGDMGRYEIDINNNCTIPDFEGIESPTYGKKRAGFRKALALLFDKNRVIDECCGGFANRVDQPIAYLHKGWRNTACWYEDGTYPYEYDPVAAVAMLDAEGFVQGTDANPNYDPGVPYSSPNLRTYPDVGGPWAAHPQKPGQTLDPIKFCIRTDDLRRTCAGDLLAAEMELVGLPLNVIYGPSSALYPIVMDAINYHIYTGGWSVGRFPPLYVYGTYHASQFFLGGSNYVTGGICPWDATEPGCLPPEEDPAWIGPLCANYPELDRMLEAARYPVDLAASQVALRQALYEFSCTQCCILDMFSARSFWAWKCDVKGVVVGEGVGLENGYMFMNAYKVDGSPLVYALITPPNEQNLIFSSWYYDFQILDRFNDGGGIGTAPYDLSIDQGGCLQYWEVSNWTGEFPCHEVVEGTKVMHIYRNNSWFQMPVTGAPIQNAREDCIYKSLMYYAQHTTSWPYTGVQDIHTARMIQGTDGCPGIELYFDTSGYWNTYYGATYWLADDWFIGQTHPLGLVETYTVEVDPHGHLNLPCPAFWVVDAYDETLAQPIEHWDGTEFGFDGWRIQKKNPNHTVWWNMDVNVGVPRAGHTVTVTVWCTLEPEQIAGYWPGDNLWNDVAIGCGPYYLVDFIPGAGGFAVLECCPFYQLETPILGEVDFVRKPDGCYRVDIFDVVMAASAYGSQGSGVPDDNWFAGADLAPECCKVDIFDIVTITSVYGVIHDCCPCPDYP
jgi:hypothetical protein